MTKYEYFFKYGHEPLSHIEFNCERYNWHSVKYRVTFRRIIDGKYFSKLFNNEEGAIHRYNMIKKIPEEYDDIKIWEVSEDRILFK